MSPDTTPLVSVDCVNPASFVCASNVPSPRLRYRMSVSFSRVNTRSVQPSPSKSSAAAPPAMNVDPGSPVMSFAVVCT